MNDILLEPDAVSKQPGDEPIPGYRLIARLGRGGFGEVWKCIAPGGLHKAVKFVNAQGGGFEQESAAFEQIKAIRHPFLLTLERVELTGGELVMVMELADGQLLDRFRECRGEGQRGVPRDELLGYLKEAAEALDMMGSKHGLQHLDVKPENVFIVAGHAKVGDYGLVRRADLAGKATGSSGFTPKYTPPEVLLGGVDIRSDQYSLALVYAELLTGTFPYPGQNAQQLMLQHVRGTPDLSGLSSSDRAAVSRALSKDPADRYPSCLAFIRELTTAVNRASPFQLPAYPRGHAFQPPQIQAGGSQSDAPTRQQATTSTVSPVLLQRVEPTPAPADPFADLYPVMRVGDLHRPRPRASGPPELGPQDFAEAVVRAASGSQSTPAVQLAAAGSQVIWFLSTLPMSMMPYKLVIVAERWGLSARQADASRVVMRREILPYPTRPAKGQKVIGGYEIVITLPEPPGVEVMVAATLFGRPDDAFVRTALIDLPVILSQIRSQLQNLEERRIHPRFNATLPVVVYPLNENGSVGRGMEGVTRDVSLGGVRFVTRELIETERVFVEFSGLPAVRDRAAYVRVLRSFPDSDGSGVISVGRFRGQ